MAEVGSPAEVCGQQGTLCNKALCSPLAEDLLNSDLAFQTPGHFNLIDFHEMTKEMKEAKQWLGKETILSHLSLI